MFYITRRWLSHSLTLAISFHQIFAVCSLKGHTVYANLKSSITKEEKNSEKGSGRLRLVKDVQLRVLTMKSIANKDIVRSR